MSSWIWVCWEGLKDRILPYDEVKCTIVLLNLLFYISHAWTGIMARWGYEIIQRRRCQARTVVSVSVPCDFVMLWKTPENTEVSWSKIK